ncbi:hypothetical protein [Bacillus licheniformis]|uniref:hypothetical protein n=1 Tax=Bacillus licheniformis TaxID=1402 RepID=UPI0018C86CA2|nr:hypothetical protein [Bacillus licheniformis]MBM6846873.1 hypothetical protein [Bacillus licheniformis]MCA1184051.1 hypothetical protein [Bacillus licheniformis]
MYLLLLDDKEKYKTSKKGGEEKESSSFIACQKIACKGDENRVDQQKQKVFRFFFHFCYDAEPLICEWGSCKSRFRKKL